MAVFSPAELVFAELVSDGCTDSALNAKLADWGSLQVWRRHVQAWPGGARVFSLCFA